MLELIKCKTDKHKAGQGHSTVQVRRTRPCDRAVTYVTPYEPTSQRDAHDAGLGARSRVQRHVDHAHAGRNGNICHDHRYVVAVSPRRAGGPSLSSISVRSDSGSTSASCSVGAVHALCARACAWPGGPRPTPVRHWMRREQQRDDHQAGDQERPRGLRGGTEWDGHEHVEEAAAGDQHVKDLLEGKVASTGVTFSGSAMRSSSSPVDVAPIDTPNSTSARSAQ